MQTAPATRPESDKPPYFWALGAGLLVFALYALTLAPSTQFWDTSEYIAAAYTLRRSWGKNCYPASLQFSFDQC